MKECTDVPVTDCLDVCLLVPGLSQAAWDKVPMTLLAFAGYHMRRNILDYLIQEGARELRGVTNRWEGARYINGEGWGAGGIIPANML